MRVILIVGKRRRINAAGLTPQKRQEAEEETEWGKGLLGAGKGPALIKSGSFSRLISPTISPFVPGNNLGSKPFIMRSLYYLKQIAVLLKTLWCCHKNRHVDQRNRTEDPEINPHNCRELVFDEVPKTLNAERTEAAGKTRYPHEEKNEVGSFTLHPK